MENSAVEWLVSELPHLEAGLLKKIINKAKEMEKKEQQKIGIIMAIFAEELGDKKCIELLNKAEQYYNETFKTN